MKPKHEGRRNHAGAGQPALRGAILGATLLATAGCASQRPPEPAAWKVAPVFSVGDASRISEAHYAIGRRHDRAGAWAMAIESYRKAIAADAQNVEAHNALGVVLSRAGRHEEATAALRLAVALDPARAHLRSNLGNALLRAGRPQEAAKELRQALVLDARDAVAMANLRRALAQTEGEGAVASRGGDEAAPQASALPAALPAERTASVEPGAVAAVGPERAVTSVAASGPLAMQVFDVPTVPSLEAPVTASFDSLLLPQAAVALPASANAPPPAAVEPEPPTFPAAPVPRVEIANGNGVVGMAARLGAFMRANGLVRQALLSNVRPFNTARTVVHYRAGFREAALRIAAGAPYPMEVAAAPGGAVNADIRVILGRDVRAEDSCAGACTRTTAGAADDLTGSEAVIASR